MNTVEQYTKLEQTVKGTGTELILERCAHQDLEMRWWESEYYF